VGENDAVARQYESHPYPHPVENLEESARLVGDPRWYSPQLWPEGRPREDLRILVAGCGTSQAAKLAFQNPGCEVTGIDVSEASLGHHRWLQEKHGLNNLRLARMDLREVRGEYELVVCTGVLHHLPDPDVGLRALAGVLAPRGAMHLMVYSYAPRAGIYLLQDAFRRLGLGQDAQGIGLVRSVLAELPKYHYANWWVSGAPELGISGATELVHDTALVDTFLHPQDRAYSVPEVLAFVERCGLVFSGWQDNGMYYPDLWVKRESSVGKALEGAPERDQWAVIENLLLMISTHGFFACRPERGFVSVDFSGDGWLGYRPVLHPEATAGGTGDRAKIVHNKLKLDLKGLDVFFLSQIDGKRTIRDIIADPRLASTAEPVRIKSACDFFSRMWRLGLMFFPR
jgi:SAM-dependent methyltransferase